MKFLKLSVFALALGLFATACNDNPPASTDEVPAADNTEMPTTPPEATPPPVAPSVEGATPVDSNKTPGELPKADLPE